MNFFEAQGEGQGPERAAKVAGLGRVVLNGQANGRREGDRVLIAIRPESLTVSAIRPEGAQTAATGFIHARQYLGGRQLLHVAIEGHAAPVAVSAGASRGEDPWAGSEGRPVWLTWGPEAVTVLEPD